MTAVSEASVDPRIGRTVTWEKWGARFTGIVKMAFRCRGGEVELLSVNMKTVNGKPIRNQIISVSIDPPGTPDGTQWVD